MMWLSFLWIFLLGIREYANSFMEKTTVITLAITLTQIFNLLLLMQKQNWKICTYHIFLAFFVILLPFNTGALLAINIVLAVILLKEIDIQRVLLVALLALSTGWFLYFSMFQLGMIKDVIGISHKGGYFHTLGFKNPNTPGLYMFYFLLIAASFILTHFRLRLPLLFFIVPIWYIHFLTRGRTGYYAAVLYLLLVFYFSFHLKYKISRFVSVFVPFLLYAITFILCLFVSKFPLLNHVFSSRFSLNAGLLNSMSFHNYIIGYKVPPHTMLDSAYLSLLICGGFFFVYLFLSIYAKGIFHMPLKNAKIFLPYLLSMVISGFAESTFSASFLSTILFYKILIDQFDFTYIRSKYIFRFHNCLELREIKDA